MRLGQRRDPAGLRLLEEHETCVRALEAAWEVAEAYGRAQSLNLTGFKAERRAERTD